MMENNKKTEQHTNDTPIPAQSAHRTFVPVETDLYTRLLDGEGQKKIDFKTTRSRLFDGALALLQPKTGYRFSLDSILLADFADVKSGSSLADLGAGVGVIGITVAKRMGHGRVVLVEIQSRLAELARRNAVENQLGPEVDVLEMDWSDLTSDVIRQPLVGGQVDYIVCNPPYRTLGTGRVNPSNEEAIARHEIMGSLVGVIKAAKGFLSPGGKLAVIYPASRLARLVTELKNRRFEPKRLRMVHSRKGDVARFVMVEAKLNAGEELEVLPPLFVYSNGRDYAPETKVILSGRPVGAP